MWLEHNIFFDCTFITGNNVEALKVALSDPPAGSKDKTLKVREVYLIVVLIV